ncbi:MAG: DinB family protein [Bryobacteraceae bacterium]|nr:DinB family protein [Bryobacteraceae bacterium]
MNPYAAFVGGGNLLDSIAGTTAKLTDLLAQLGDRVGQPIAPGKWSPAQILCHLADAEIAFAFRLRQGMAEDHHVIQPFDQDGWSCWYATADSATALAAFTALRNWNLCLLKSLTPEQMAKPVTHPERGTMKLATILETMAGHDQNHIRQLEAMLKAA